MKVRLELINDRFYEVEEKLQLSYIFLFLIFEVVV